jgi:hypothetical protein
MDTRERQAAAVCAIGGSFLLPIGTFLHPVPADPNDAAERLLYMRETGGWLVTLCSSPEPSWHWQPS